METEKMFLGQHRERKITWRTWGEKPKTKRLTEAESLSIQAQIMGHLISTGREETLFLAEGVSRRDYTIYKRPQKLRRPRNT